MKSTFTKVRDVVAEVLDIDQDQIPALTVETRLVQDLDADSFDAVTLLLTLENDLNIDLDEGEVLACVTIGDIVSMVERASK